MALSKEEKKARKEAKKLEKLKAEAEARKQLKIQELQREMVIHAKNRSLIEKRWRDMMLRIKLPVFRQDIEVMWQVFERAIDKKDHLIKYTMKLTNVADEQVSRTISSFCDTVDTMINKFIKDLEDLCKDNDVRTKELLKRGENDERRIMGDHNAAETHLQLLLYHGHTIADNNAWSTRGEDLVKQDEERSKFSSEREILRSYLENIYNTTWDEYKAVLRAYVVGTVDNQKKLRKLRRKENLMADIIASQSKHIANNDNVLKNLRNELQQYESGTKQLVFRDRRNRHRAACKKLKIGLENGCVKDEKQLAVLVKVSDESIVWLSEAQEKAEKILRLASLCRKLETRKEKVLPFGCKLPDSAIELTGKEDLLVTNAMSATSGLNRLWQRIANAELSRKALLREKLLLERENNFIMSQIRNRDSIETKISSKQCVCTSEIKKGKTRPVAVDGIQAIKHYKYNNHL